jgi:hypothetical protein
VDRGGEAQRRHGLSLGHAGRGGRGAPTHAGRGGRGAPTSDSIPQGPKATYIVHGQMCKYAGNPLTGGETTIYKYIHLT